MPHIQVPAASAALTVNGPATGLITVGSNAGFFVGAECWLVNTDAGSNQRCVVTELQGTTIIGLRFIEEDNRGGVATKPAYGRSSCVAYTTAKSSTLWQSQQSVYVDPPYTKTTV